jgi:hypothetical protein
MSSQGDSIVKEPNKKRQAREMYDHTALNVSLATSIKQVRDLENPSIKDLITFFTNYIETQLEKEKNERDELHVRLSDVEEKSEKHEKQITDLQDVTYSMQISSTQTNNTIEDCEFSLHKLEQKNIDNDVFISLIPFSPNAQEITEKLLSLCDVPLDSLKNSYSFAMRPVQKPAANSTANSQSSRAPKYAMVISFDTVSTKMRFLTNRSKNGPIKWSQVTTECPQDCLDISLKCMNRLSTFNLKVLRELNIAKGKGAITSFNMHNNLFRVKVKEKDPWRLIGTEANLAHFLPQDVSMAN